MPAGGREGLFASGPHLLKLAYQNKLSERNRKQAESHWLSSVVLTYLKVTGPQFETAEGGTHTFSIIYHEAPSLNKHKGPSATSGDGI